MAQLRRLSATLAIVTCLVSTSLVQAAPLYWSGGSTGGAAPAAGSGTWSTSASYNYWATAETGGVNAAWSDGSDALFSIDGSSTVTVSGTVATNAIAFTGAGYTVQGGTITLGAGGMIVDRSATFNGSTLNVNASTATVWTVNGENTLTITGGSVNIPSDSSLSIQGTGNVYTTARIAIPSNQRLLTMNGTGTLTLAGTGDNGGMGLQVKSGTVVLAKQSTSGVHAVGGPGIGSIDTGALVQLAGSGGDQIYTSAPVTLTGGTLDFNGQNEGFNALNGTGAVLNNAAGTTSTMSIGDSNGGGDFLGTITDGASGTGIMAVTKTGTGTQTLSGNNTYSGATTVNAGTLRLGNANALGSTASGTTVLSGAVLDLNGQTVGTETLTLAGTGISGAGALINSSGTAASLAGDIASGTYTVGGTGNITLAGNVQGSLTKVGSNTLTLGGTVDNNGLAIIANSGTIVLGKNPSSGSPAVHAIGGGGLTIAGATVQLGSSGGDQIYNDANVTVNSGVFDLNGQSETISALGGSGGTILNGAASTTSTLTVGSNNGNGTFSGSIANGSGAVALTKIGSGSQTLSGNNTYSGLTTVSKGTLVLGSSTALGSTAGATTVASGAVLDLNGQDVGAETLTLAGTGMDGSGALVNSSDTAASLAGEFLSSTYSVGGTGDITLTNNIRGTLTKVGTNTLTLGGTVDNSGLAVIANSGTVLLAKNPSKSSVHAIGGGGLTVAGATVKFAGPGEDQIYFQANVTVNSGLLDFNGYSEGFDALGGSGGTILNNAANTTSVMTLGEYNENGSYAGIIADGAGVMALTKTGTGTQALSGANAYSGETTIKQGVLKLASSGSINSSTTIDVQSGATLDLTAKTSGFTFTAGQTLTGAGTVQMATGSTVSVQGVLAPGSSMGTLTFAGNGTLDISSDDAELTFDLGASSDQVLLSEGVVDIGMGVLDFNDFTFTTITGFGLGTYTLFETNQLIVGSLGSNLSGVIDGISVYLSLSADGTDLQLNAVCEPSSLPLVAAAAFALGGIGWRSKRRKRV